MKECFKKSLAFVTCFLITVLVWIPLNQGVEATPVSETSIILPLEISNTQLCTKNLANTFYTINGTLFFENLQTNSTGNQLSQFTLNIFTTNADSMADSILLVAVQYTNNWQIDVQVDTNNTAPYSQWVTVDQLANFNMSYIYDGSSITVSADNQFLYSEPLLNPATFQAWNAEEYRNIITNGDFRLNVAGDTAPLPTPTPTPDSTPTPAPTDMWHPIGGTNPTETTLNINVPETLLIIAVAAGAFLIIKGKGKGGKK